MKQPFVNATMNDRRKGREVLSHTTQPHPARPVSVSSSDTLPPLPSHFWRIPVEVKKVAPPAPLSDLEVMKHELLKAMRAVEKKPKTVSKSKLIGMANASAQEDPVRDYNDILAMLLAKK